jgi:hypothetical protein
MGWHYDLKVRCTIRPEFRDFFEKEYIRRYKKYGDELRPYSEIERMDTCTCDTRNDIGCPCFFVEEYGTLSKSYRDLLECWMSLRIDPLFYGYALKDDTFELHISKKVNHHHGNLRTDMEQFVKDVLVPTTSFIHLCEIKSDDYGDSKWIYTDLELRGGSLYLHQIVRSVQHVWIEGEIAESRVIYKRGIPKHQQLDLDRLFHRGF